MTTSRQLYDSYYYHVYDGRPYERNEEWLRFFGGIAQEIVNRIGPKTVLDAGCALGFLVETLRDRKVEAYGVDISEYAIQHVYSSIRPYCQVASITEPFPQKYDLIVTIEVLEHLDRPDAEKAVANLCRHCDDILFSSTPYEYKDLTHINVQPSEVWAEMFARQGFFRDLDFDASFIIPWAMRFRRRSDPPQRILMEYERHLFRLRQENMALRQLEMDLQNKIVNQINQMAFNENLVAELRDRNENLMAEFAELRCQNENLIAELAEFRDRNENLIAEFAELRDRNKNLIAELAEFAEIRDRNENLIAELRYQVEDITHSRAFRLGRQIRRLVPLGSRREKWLLKIFSPFGNFFANRAKLE